jgi:DNA-directed RNA polymerase subunit RPC12/RpoP
MMENFIEQYWEPMLFLLLALMLSLGLMKHRNIIHQSLKDTKDFNDIIRDYEAHKISRELHVPTPGRYKEEHNTNSGADPTAIFMEIPPRKKIAQLPPAKKPKFKKCSGCGARKTVLKNGNYECDYCGSDAVQKKDQQTTSGAGKITISIDGKALAGVKMVKLPETNENDRVRF